MNVSGILHHFQVLGIKNIAEYRKGDKWQNASCPFAPWRHRNGTDRRPSFGVKVQDTGQSVYYCHGCHSHGKLHDLYDELGRLRGVDYREERKRVVLEEARGFPSFEDAPMLVDDEDDLTPLSEVAYRGLFRNPFEVCVAREYLEQRRVTERAGEVLELGFDPDEQRITFPVRDHQGRLMGFTGRSLLLPPQCPVGRPYPKVRDYYGLPKKHLLLGENLIEVGKPIFVVEGLFDFAHLISRGIQEYANVVAMMGSTLTHQKASRLIAWGEDVYMLPDNDEAGNTCLFGNSGKGGALDKLHPDVTVFAPEYPEGADEPTDLEISDVLDMLEHR